MGDDPEQEARDALARGDREGALTILVRAYGSALYRFCRQMVADPDLAHDVHQTTFLQAFEGLGGFGGRMLFRAWLYRIARHRCLDALKIARRRESKRSVNRTFPSLGRSAKLACQEVSHGGEFRSLKAAERWGVAGAAVGTGRERRGGRSVLPAASAASTDAEVVAVATGGWCSR